MSTNYLYDPLIEKLTVQYNNEAACKFIKYKNEINDNIIDEIIILNNSLQSEGFIDFMKTFNDLQNKNIKVYLYKKNGLELILGPVLIDSISKIMHINTYIINFISRENFAYYKTDMENVIENEFNSNINLVKFYY